VLVLRLAIASISIGLDVLFDHTRRETRMPTPPPVVVNIAPLMACQPISEHKKPQCPTLIAISPYQHSASGARASCHMHRSMTTVTPPDVGPPKPRRAAAWFGACADEPDTQVISRGPD